MHFTVLSGNRNQAQLTVSAKSAAVKASPHQGTDVMSKQLLQNCTVIDNIDDNLQTQLEQLFGESSLQPKRYFVGFCFVVQHF